MTYLALLSILAGAVTTLVMSTVGIALGLPIGLALALARWGRVPVVSRLVALTVSLLRATPLITLVMLLFFGLPEAGLDIGPKSAGIIALVLNMSAFNCEIWRAALMSFPKDQIESAQSVGMSRTLWFRLIVFPQIFRTCLPALVNEMSQLIKLTPVLAVVGVVDITRAAARVGAETYEPLPPFLVAIGIYIPIVLALLLTQRWLTRRQTHHEATA
jgi:His/Glu/Gln/Arg/opine family amino acid ABC transporter permease subunit